MLNTIDSINQNPMYEKQPRFAGILLHITSLPGPYGIGDLGSAAFSFADFLSDAGVGLWQILPLGPVGYGSSPYAARSSFAGNELLISPDILIKEGFLEEADAAELKMAVAQNKNKINQVDYGLVENKKFPLLKKAARRFIELKGENNPEFDNFCRREVYWLEDYAVFQLMCEEYYDARWHTIWDKRIAKRDNEAMAKLRTERAKEILDWKVLQYFFECQWQVFKKYVNGKGIKIIGDIPIFAAPDSADTWSRLDLFKTDDEGNYTLVSGVPPDYFSATGQLWGNPVYDWKKNKNEGYSWWTDRIRRLLSQVDLFRIDHFRGFDEYWAIPAGNPTAEHGTWEKGPGADLFYVLEKNLGKLPILAEDLGFLTDSVVNLRNELRYPGMKVCQFGFEDMKNGSFDSRHLFLPHNYSYNWVAYTGTHDNETSAAWYSNLGEKDKETVSSYLSLSLNFTGNSSDAAWAMIRAVVSSHAKYAIFPMQDILGLGSEARFNTPSTCNDKNWAWRLDEIPDTKLANRIKSLLYLFGRCLSLNLPGVADC